MSSQAGMKVLEKSWNTGFQTGESCMSAIMGIMHLKCSDNAVNKVCQDYISGKNWK